MIQSPLIVHDLPAPDTNTHLTIIGNTHLDGVPSIEDFLQIFLEQVI